MAVEVKQRGVAMIRSGLLAVLVLLGSPLLHAADAEAAQAGRSATAEEQERMQRWQSLPPEKRERLRQRYEKFKQLPPEEQEAVKQRYNKWREMPAEDRRAMRDKWQSMSPEDRKAFRQRFHGEDGGDRGTGPGNEGSDKQDKKKRSD